MTLFLNSSYSCQMNVKNMSPTKLPPQWNKTKLHLADVNFQPCTRLELSSFSTNFSTTIRSSKSPRAKLVETDRHRGVISGQSRSCPSEVKGQVEPSGVVVMTSAVLIGYNPLEMKWLKGFGEAPDLPTYRRRNALPVHSPGYVAEFVHQGYITFHQPHDSFTLVLVNHKWTPLFIALSNSDKKRANWINTLREFSRG